MFRVMVFPYGRRRFLRNLAGRQYFVFPPHGDMRTGWGYHYEKVVIWHLKKMDTPRARSARRKNTTTSSGDTDVPYGNISIPRGILMFHMWPGVRPARCLFHWLQGWRTSESGPDPP